MLFKIPLSNSIISLDFKSKVSSINTNYVDVFEAGLEEYYQFKKKVVALNSGTSAIHLALILAGVTKNDEVLCQSFTYVATANPILYQGATPIFIDSEEETWNMCPVFLEEAILDRIKKGKKPKAILFVHIYGMPAKVDEIVAIAKKYNIILIEDAAEALGASYKGKKCGSFGDFGILSFNTNKIITTLGGGALICKNKKEKENAIFYATQSKDKATYYKHSKIGYNYRLNNLSATLGIQELKKIESEVLKRRDVNNIYRKYFKNNIKVSVFKSSEEFCYSNHWLTSLLFNEEVSNTKIKTIKSTLALHKIETRFLWKPLHTQPLFCNELFYGKDTSEKLFKRGLSVPSSSHLKSEDLNIICETINKLL